MSLHTLTTCTLPFTLFRDVRRSLASTRQKYGVLYKTATRRVLIADQLTKTQATKIYQTLLGKATNPTLENPSLDPIREYKIIICKQKYIDVRNFLSYSDVPSRMIDSTVKTAITETIQSLDLD